MKKYSIIQYVIKIIIVAVVLLGNAYANTTSKNNLPTQKVVLTCDRDFYLRGEKIIFSARVFTNEKPDTELSKILYVELFKNDLSITKAKYKLINGHVQAYLKIPEDLVSGNYYLRAYTMYMRNKPPETYFNKHLTIINPEGKVDTYSGKFTDPVIISTQNKNLIADINNCGAILFSKDFINNIENAYITDNKNDSIANVTIYKNGLGRFSFVPEMNKKYNLKLLLKNKDSIFINMEDVRGKGLLSKFNYNMRQAEIIQNLYDIKSSLNIWFINPYFEIIKKKEIIITDTITNINFYNTNFPQGINYMLVTDMDNKILSVSPFYAGTKVPDEDVKILSDSVFNRRSLVSVDIDGISTGDDIDVYVTKARPENSVDLLPMKILYNPLLLNTDSRVFDSENKLVIDQLYSSFLINKDEFNKIDFENIISAYGNDKTLTINSEKLPEIRDISLSGKLINKNTSEALPNQTVYASVLGEKPQLHNYITDSTGNFLFSLNQLEGIYDVGLSIDSITDINAKIIVNNDFSVKFPYYIDFPVQADSLYSSFLISLYRNQQIDYKFRQLVKTDQVDIDNIPFPFQNPQTSILLSDYIELATMQEVLNEIVTYVSARMNKGKMTLNVLNDRTEIQYSKPLVLIDNLVVFNLDELMKLKPSKVEKIEVITKPYTLGSKDFQGIIMITSKAGDFGGMQLPDATVFLKYITASPFTYYEYPDFGNENIASQQPYFANTIYNISKSNIDENDSHFSFFTSDESGKFEIVVSVIRSDGSTTKTTKTIEIR